MALSCPQSAKNWWAEHSQALCRLGEVLLAFASGVLTIVSFGSPFWIENEQGTLDHEGLWQECQANPAKCNPLSQDRLSSPVLATRAMMCLALISGLAAWGLSIGALLVHKPKILFPAAVAYGLQVFWLFLGLVIYVAVFQDQAHKGDRGWAYTVGWLALVFSLTCCVYFILVAWYRLKNPDSNQPKMQQIYAPLTQMEDNFSDSDDDDDNL